MPHPPPSRTRSFAAAALVAVIGTMPAQAHNESVHQRMTDYAYHVLLAAAAVRDGRDMSARLRSRIDSVSKRDPSVAALLRAASRARPRLQSLKSGLPLDDTPCIFPPFITAVGGVVPDWQLPAQTPLIDVAMKQVRFPVTVHYGHGPVICAIDIGWQPSGVLASVNPGTLTTRDHTGVTLGYWAAAPDKEKHDWVLSSTTLGALQVPLAVAAGFETTAAASAACILACGLFPPACVACPALGIAAGVAAIDEITSIDASALESEDYVGLGHFIDMKPPPAGATLFDTQPGKSMLRAGPNGVPDMTEDIVILAFELGGVHVNHAKSSAPGNYEIVLGASGAVGTDGHVNSTRRSASQWQAPLLPQLELTAVDNLAMFGYRKAREFRGASLEARRLGWPLHALGDASVPMHAVGASGWGHRPYEDSVDARFDTLVAASNAAASIETVVDVLQRAAAWRTFIEARRATLGSPDVPLRDLVTAVADRTRVKAAAQPQVFSEVASLAYIVDQDAAVAFYESAAMSAVQRDLLVEGIAATLAFLIAYTEVGP
jgi:hypothetical protein